MGEEIRIHILEQELMDEQKQVEQLKDAIDALKIEISTLNANLQKMKSVERKSTDGTNDDDALLRMSDLSKQNQKLTKKIKIQQKKIEMFKKKVKKQKALLDGKEGNTVSSADGSLDVSAMSALDLSIQSSGSSISSCSLSGHHRKSKKRKYADMDTSKSKQ